MQKTDDQLRFERELTEILHPMDSTPLTTSQRIALVELFNAAGASLQLWLRCFNTHSSYQPAQPDDEFIKSYDPQIYLCVDNKSTGK